MQIHECIVFSGRSICLDSRICTYGDFNAYTLHFFMVFGFGGAEKLQKSVINGRMKKVEQEQEPGETEYIFDHDGIQINSEKGSGINYWKAFRCYGIIKNYIYIKRFDNQIVLVDKEKLTPEKLCELEELLKANCKYDQKDQ
ncbi:MAG: hypothetical protein PHY47_13065 [Lachnospiraceae bacterium]|nr:hypothetical protein [Lachnospiraceae bacterium]